MVSSQVFKRVETQGYIGAEKNVNKGYEMSGSAGRGIDKVLGQWERGKEEAKMRKDMEGFMLKLTKVKAPARKKGKKGKKK